MFNILYNIFLNCRVHRLVISMPMSIFFMLLIFGLRFKRYSTNSTLRRKSWCSFFHFLKLSTLFLMLFYHWLKLFHKLLMLIHKFFLRHRDSAIFYFRGSFYFFSFIFFSFPTGFTLIKFLFKHIFEIIDS